jgi:hypothetical protein
MAMRKSSRPSYCSAARLGPAHVGPARPACAALARVCHGADGRSLRVVRVGGTVRAFLSLREMETAKGGRLQPNVHPAYRTLLRVTSPDESTPVPRRRRCS